MKPPQPRLRAVLAATLAAWSVLSAAFAAAQTEVRVEAGASAAPSAGAAAAAGSVVPVLTGGVPALNGAPAALSAPALVPALSPAAGGAAAALAAPAATPANAALPASALVAAAPSVPALTAAGVPHVAAPAFAATPASAFAAAADGPKSPAENGADAHGKAALPASAQAAAGADGKDGALSAGALDGYFDQSRSRSGAVLDPVQHTAEVLAGNLPEDVRPKFDPAAGERQRAALKAWHDAPHRTYLLVNSYSFKDDGTPGLNYYDMRPLAQILWAADPKVDVIFVTAMPVDESMIRHVLQGHPKADEIRKRVHFVSLNDAGNDFLSQKLLDPKHAGALTQIDGLIKKIGAPAALYPYMGGPYEWRIAAQLGIPDSVYAANPSMIYWGTKSGGRKVFKAAMERYTGTKRVRVKLSDGAEDLYDADSAADELGRMLEKHPDWSKVAVKLNLGSSGEGNFFPTVTGFGKLSVEERRRALLALLRSRPFGIPDEKTGKQDSFADALANEGAALEEFIPGIGRATFPSVQSEILPDGNVRILSSHEQILVDGNNYVGAHLAADNAYRKVLERAAYEAAVELSKKGIVGRFGTDFAVIRQKDGTYDAYYIENNIRLTGTTHPLVAASGLTGASYDDGALRKAETSGKVRYKSMDHDVRPNLVGLDVDGFLARFDKDDAKDLLFDPQRQSGVLFHLVPAVKAAGNVGYTIIGRNAHEVETIQKRLSAVLDRLEIEHLSGGDAPALSRSVHDDARTVVEAKVGHVEQVKRFKRFLDARPESLYRRGAAAGIVFHPHGYTVLGRDAAELSEYDAKAKALLNDFAAQTGQ
jgi:hypothetical protein